ncbi:MULTISPECIES: Lrp/AsnC family transcriptional regulator [unclassified Pseudoalteromonas]|uniref:Lrp/AsnC family transcriptional regulator n=1 Tax=unclassified Pseudoalteromonas TaxID=194690 RepID=UPI0005A6A992|nr:MULTISPECIES: Lrp/AsnC family transcriptional regulator [unclassified Pseudoalteromonas]
MQISLDRMDKRILQLMQQNGRISNLELADQVGLSPTPCSRRVKRLEESGIISNHVTLLDQKALNLNLTALIGIELNEHTPEKFDQFEQAISILPEIMECSIVTGQTSDIIMKVIVRDMEHYEQFLLNQLMPFAGISSIHSSFILRKIINKTDLPLE